MLVRYTTAAASACFEHRAYEAAVGLSELADALRDPESQGSSTIARLSAVAQARLSSDTPAFARNEAADLTESEVDSLVEQPLDRTVVAAKPKRRRRRSRPRKTTPIETADTSADEKAAPQTSPRLNQEATQLRFTSLFSSGEKYEAFSYLQTLTSAHPNVTWLKRLRVRYGPDREKLVAELLSNGESALQREKPEQAYRYYQRVLDVEQDNEIALDRIRKIENLRKLRRRVR
ncbi:MAG: hypothetical protein AAFQ82_08185 [Myxococcota bacterium]